MVAALHVDRTANLPRSLTRLVGRGHELAALRNAILRPVVPLVTLTGAGGVGKTRLAIEVATGLTDSVASAAMPSRKAAKAGCNETAATSLDRFWSIA
jgi:predicted ribonuclease YlaK